MSALIETFNLKVDQSSVSRSFDASFFVREEHGDDVTTCNEPKQEDKLIKLEELITSQREYRNCSRLRLADNHSNLLLRRKALWTDFDRWIDEEPSVRRHQFEIIRSALLVHCEYASIVFNKIGEDEEQPPMQKFTSFMNLANQTRFLQAPSATIPTVNIFGVLVDLLITIPEFRSEDGVIHHILKKYLCEMLDSDLDWDAMHCNPKLVRSVYWQLLFTLHLAPVQSEHQTEETMVYDANRPKLMFGCFILAVLVGIAYENEIAVSSAITNYYEMDDLPTFLLMLISSTHFRALSQFFLVGLWLLKRYKMDGGRVTTDQLLTPEQMEEQFRNRTIEERRSAVDQEQETDEIQREWETFTVGLLKKGFLKSPDGFKIVQKGGRPRKYLINQGKKRKSGEQMPREEPAPPPAQQKKKSVGGRYQKKGPKASPKKQPRGKYANRHIELFDEPSTSNMPSTSAAPPKPQRIVPKPEDVGLCHPIFMMQMNFKKIFNEECERRMQEGSSSMDSRRVESAVFATLEEIHDVAKWTAAAPRRNLTSDQKLVMKEFKDNFRRLNVEEVAEPVAEEDPEPWMHAEAEAERFSSPRGGRGGGKRGAKRWRRNHY
ncbi:hypothetical protein L3Y34_007496 [Caenorhabditis briggsae]|uniref:Uncharacterized protein n=1 Tax=Caenorhabditis briggsae TaxID=6238 RepID=A0AAE8ZWZ9_CAEBR|nr:hypothetical protein L3Y34_007496 [Caenorhabditis briggsae]